MRPAFRLCAAPPGFPGFWKRSLDEFKRLGNIAIKFETLQGPKNVLPLWDFSEPQSVEGCVELSDNDIGGFSKANLVHVPASDTEPAHAHFAGHISREIPNTESKVDRMGYAAWRTRDRPATMFGRTFWDVEFYNFLAMRVKSDGRKYKVNIQTESLEYTDLHQHRLYAKRPGEWETVLIKWKDFVRTNHGMIVEPQSDMYREKVRTIGIGLTDRVSGPFDFRISRIWATNGLTGDELKEADRREAKWLPEEPHRSTQGPGTGASPR